MVVTSVCVVRFRDVRRLRPDECSRRACDSGRSVFKSGPSRTGRGKYAKYTRHTATRHGRIVSGRYSNNIDRTTISKTTLSGRCFNANGSGATEWGEHRPWRLDLKNSSFMFSTYKMKTFIVQLMRSRLSVVLIRDIVCIVHLQSQLRCVREWKTAEEHRFVLCTASPSLKISPGCVADHRYAHYRTVVDFVWKPKIRTIIRVDELQQTRTKYAYKMHGKFRTK